MPDFDDFIQEETPGSSSQQPGGRNQARPEGAPDAANGSGTHRSSNDRGARQPSPDSDLDAYDVTDEPTPPPREWLLGNYFCRKFISGLIAVGAGGKTALRIAQLLQLAANKGFLGDHIFVRCRIFYLSLEDDRDEINRRVHAAMIYHGITPEDIRGYFYISTKRGLKIARPGKRTGQREIGNMVEAIRREIDRIKPDIIVLDPLVKTHEFEENDNGGMDFVIDQIAQIAIEKNIAMDSPHHARKGTATPGDAEMGRGASSIKDAGRLVYTITTMTEKEAEQFHIAEDERRLYFRLDSAKVNIAPPSRTARWFKVVGVALNNGNDLYPNGDEVQTVEAWIPPPVTKGLTPELTDAIFDQFERGNERGQRYSAHGGAKDRLAWEVIANHTGKSEAASKEVLEEWLRGGETSRLYIDEWQDPSDRKKKKAIFVRARHPNRQTGASDQVACANENRGSP